MKKIFLPFYLLVTWPVCFSQTMQATLKKGSTSNSVDIYLKSSETFSRKDDAMTFVLAIPTFAAPETSLGSVGTTANTTGNVLGIKGLQPSFLINRIGTTTRQVVVSKEVINGSSYYVYTFIFGGTASANHTWVASEEQHIFSIQFNGCSEDCIKNLLLINLAKGGVNANSYWYFQANALGDITNYKAPFYTSDETTSTRDGGDNGSSLVTLGLRTTSNQVPGSSVQVYPTLTSGLINIRLPEGLEEATITVSDVSGKTVVHQSANGSNNVIDLNKASNGTYVVSILYNMNAVNRTRIILQK